MAILASTIVTRARNTLLDPTPGAGWTDAELLDYLNAAITAVVSNKPDANVVSAFRVLPAGSLQTLPAGGVQILNVTRNQSGRQIRQATMDSIRDAGVSLPNANPGAVIQNYIPDARNPRQYYTFPPSDGTANVEEVYSATPTRLAALTDAIALVDTYETALHLYTVAMAYAKNSKRGDLIKFQTFMGQFLQVVGAKSQGQFSVAPRLELLERQ